MKAANESWLEVDTPEAAHALTTPEEFRFLKPFLSREQTIGQAAAKLGVSPLLMYRRVKHLETLGLIQVAGLLPRKGKALKRYRAAAEEFFVPFDLLKAETLEAEMLRHDDFWRRRLIRGLTAGIRDMPAGYGYHIFQEPSGLLRTIGTSRLGSPKPEELAQKGEHISWSDWSVVRLEPEQAKAIQQELIALFRRYSLEGHNKNKGQAYIVRTAMAPVVKD